MVCWRSVVVQKNGLGYPALHLATLGHLLIGLLDPTWLYCTLTLVFFLALHIRLLGRCVIDSRAGVCHSGAGGGVSRSSGCGPSVRRQHAAFRWLAFAAVSTFAGGVSADIGDCFHQAFTFTFSFTLCS